MKKVLFFINSLRQGGAERILVNLANNLDKEKYNVTVLTLFDVGINKQYLFPHVQYRYVFKKRLYGLKQIFKLLPPSLLHKFCVKDKYDLEVAYLQGITTRIISASKVPSVAWIHGTFNPTFHSKSYRSIKEMNKCYERFNCVACVSAMVAKSFCDNLSSTKKVEVVYNTQDCKNILLKSKEHIAENFDETVVNLITAGSFLKVKGYCRLLNCIKRLKEDNFSIHLYMVGSGEEKESLSKQIKEDNLEDIVTFLGFQENPYKYIARSDLFICSSYSEGFSGTVAEATILGIPTLTTSCSGMNEILGDNNDYGIIVENSEEALYNGLKDVLEHPEILAYYKGKVKERSSFFSTEATVKAVEDLFDSLIIE